MKLIRPRRLRNAGGSHPARGAWIEICKLANCSLLIWSHPARGAWIEISTGVNGPYETAMSHPARGAWIEITMIR